jgi:hypothetical protein
MMAFNTDITNISAKAMSEKSFKYVNVERTKIDKDGLCIMKNKLKNCEVEGNWYD